MELSERSLIGENLIDRFNAEMERYEQQQGVCRVAPGQLLEECRGQQVLLPLWSDEAIDRLAKGGRLSEYYSHVELEQYVRLQEVVPEATPQDLWSLTAKPVFGRMPKLALVVPSDGIERTDALSSLKIPTPVEVGAMAKPRTLTDVEQIPREVNDRLVREFSEGFGLRASMLIAIFRVLGGIREWLYPQASTLVPGQVVWLARSLNAQCDWQGHSLGLDYVPVILTHHTVEERPHAYTPVTEFFEVELRRVARMTVEAWSQGGVLSNIDLAMLLHRSPAHVRKLLDTYQQRHGVLLPTTGTVLDMGSTLTHKKLAVEWYLQGYNTSDIARRLFHTPQAIDNYLRMFNKVAMLYVMGFPENAMPWLLSCSKSLVNEHLNLVKKYLPDRQQLLAHLEKEGVPIASQFNG